MKRKSFLFAAAALLLAVNSFAASAPTSVAQIPLYQGADREKILIDGAKREGQVTFYNTHTWFRTFVKDFEKKYPFIKVNEWRNETKNLLRRVTEEAKAGRNLVDVIETTPEAIGILKRDGYLQEYNSPEARFYPEDVKSKGKNGYYWIGDRETYIGLGFNTNLIPAAEAPKTLRDLLNPKWKGKMSIVNTSSGTRWIGNAIDAMGREFVDKFAEQDVRLQDMSGAALSGLVVTGEVPLSPTIFDANVSVHKQKGAPIEWRPLEPVVTNVGYSTISIKSPNPHAAMLLLDYIHSKEGQHGIMKGGLWSPRDDMGGVEQRFKKSYLDEKYLVDELENKYGQWEQLIRRLFGQRK